ncbi:carbon-nitrogen hydrolase family protein [Thermaerobacter composti]|uniref:Carbon-nitrogen hydrolase family protein n=1 Tax=Thermaerobacter composti TaxID=554949 RepID=A0ABZ0QMN4_9FIRM|nr:carbon-nitrogen hydrolase family protein [Thermaerobacter composti]WPD18529.1 carbon-nitrogen hydrolase family protein [Thermaerobacter composti]
MTSVFRVAALQTPAFSLEQAQDAARYLLDVIDRAATTEPRPDLLVLPECAYPAYYLAPCQDVGLESYLREAGAPTVAEFLAAVSDRARQHHVAIACGVALPGSAGELTNGVVLFDRDGRRLVTAAKMFLWHFDGRWFQCGAQPALAELDGIKVGLFVCCDGRAPEIPRSLAVAGAELLVDSTNWVTSGRSVAHLPNAQPDFMMKIRALENRAWLVAANKVGMEADCIVYCGKSSIFDPDGQVVVMASTHQPEVVTAAIPIEGDHLQGTGPGRPVADRLDPVAVRRSGAYLQLSSAATGSDPAPEQAPFVAVLQLPPEEPWSRIGRLVADMVVQGAAVLLFSPGLVAGQPSGELLQLSRSFPVLFVVTGDETTAEGRYRTAWLLHEGRVLGVSRKGHLESEEQRAGYRMGPAEPAVFPTPWGNLAIIQGAEMLVPEVARSASLQGADLLLWPHDLTSSWVEDLARTRAAENRVYVAAAAPAIPGGESMIVDPAGTVLGRTFPGRRQGVGAYCLLPVARHKWIVPGTHALAQDIREAWAHNLNL